MNTRALVAISTFVAAESRATYSRIPSHLNVPRLPLPPLAKKPTGRHIGAEESHTDCSVPVADRTSGS
jgi:hypothetical protein